MVSKQTGWIITAVLGVLFGCAAIFTCVSGVLSIGSTLSALRFGGGAFGSGVWARFGSEVCMSLGFIALPVVFYVVLVASNKSEPAPTPAEKDVPAPAAAPAPDTKDKPAE